MNYFDLMNLENIYLDNINEPEDNHVVFKFSRSKRSEVSESLNIGGVVLENSYSIDIDYTLPLIQMDFECYIGYSILNESYTVSDDYDIFEGKIIRICSRSRYLDFIKSVTIASEDYPGPFKHYQICCLNHIIDVVSVSEPLIKEVDRKVTLK